MCERNALSRMEAAFSRSCFLSWWPLIVFLRSDIGVVLRRARGIFPTPCAGPTAEFWNRSRWGRRGRLTSVVVSVGAIGITGEMYCGAGGKSCAGEGSCSRIC